MPEGRRTLNVEQLTAGVPKREELPKLTKKQLAEHIYDFYIEINITDPKNGVGKDEWVRRMLNGGGGAPAAKKDELIRQLSSILEDRENDIHYINAVAGQHGLERLKSRVSFVNRFSRNTLETELDARDDTAIPDERNASLSAFSTSEIAEIVENYSAYKRPFTAQFLAEWEAAENGAIDYRAAVERVIDEEYKNRPNYLDAPKIAFIHSYFVRQREQELEYLDERQYQALWQTHLDGDNILECLSQEYETNFEGRLTSDEDVTRLIEQFTYTYYSDILIARNEPNQEKYPSIYVHDRNYALLHDELKLYEASMAANQQCKIDLKTAIDNYFDYDERKLNTGFETALIEKYGIDRIALLCANTITWSDYSEHHTQENREWAKAQPQLGATDKMSVSVLTNVVGLNLFVDRIRALQAENNADTQSKVDYFGKDNNDTAYYRVDYLNERTISGVQVEAEQYVIAGRECSLPKSTMEGYNIQFITIGKDINEEEFVLSAPQYLSERLLRDKMRVAADEALNKVYYKNSVVDIIEREFINSPYSQVNENNTYKGQGIEILYLYFQKQKEQGLDALDEKDYRTLLFKCHLEGHSILEDLFQELEEHSDKDLSSDDKITELVKQFTHTIENERDREESSSENRSTLQQAIQEEFAGFKAVEMKKSPEEIFSNMQKIHFFTEVTNFFSNEENVAALPDAAVAALYSESPSTLSLLYDYYLKQEYAGVENSEQVRELIDGYIERYFPENTNEVTELPAEKLLQEPLFGVVYNWKGLKEENSVYTAAQLSAEDPDFNPALEQQDGAFAANKTYIVYKLNGATVEETAENVKAFMTGSKNYEAEQAPLIPGWYWETVNYNLFTGVVNPTVDTFVEHFGLSDEALRMQEQEELSPWGKLEAQTQELVKTTGNPHVLIEWSESGAVPDETIMTFEDADRLLSGLNATHRENGYYKTKLHIYYQDGDTIGTYADVRYDIGTETNGLVEHIEEYAKDLVDAGFASAEEQQERLHVANILKEYMQGVYAAENLEKEVEAWREQNITLFTEGKIREILPFPNYVSIPYNEFSAATGWGCSIEELVTWGKEHQKGTAEQKQWVVDYLEDINFHTEAGLLSEGKYDEFEELIVQRRVEMKLDNIRADGASIKEIETRINLASKYTLEQLESEIDARTAYDAGRSPENLDVELHREMSDISNKDLYKTVEDYDAYSHKFAPVVLRVYKNFALPTAEELAAEIEQSAANEPKPLPVKQKQNIKTVLGGKYNADDLQKYLSKELEENALKNAQSEKEFLSFLASFRSRQYSVRNQLMLYIQAAQNDYMPIFGTFEEWKGKGTSIQPGTHGLTICRPVFTDVYYEEVNVDGEMKKKRYVKFATTKEKLKELEEGVKAGTVEKATELTHFIYTDSVFSMSQTTMTEEQRIEYLQRYNAYNTSTENEALYEKLKVIAAELGRPVVERPIKGEELGWVERAENGTIVIKEDMPVDAKISVLAHEIGHKLLHIQNATADNRAQKEVQAQLFSHLAMLKLGIDAEKQFSLSYINNWLKAGEKDPPVFDADGRQLSKGEVLQLNLAAVIPAVDALLKTVGEKEQAIDTEALKELKDYKAEQKPQPEQRTSKKEGKVEIEPLKVLKETDKAVFVKIPGANPEDPKKGIWLPRSCISVSKEGFVYEATPTVIQEKGLTPKAALSATKGFRAQRILKI